MGRGVWAVLAAMPLLMANTLSNAEAAGRFGARESLTDVRIAPDGRSLLYLSANDDRKTSVYVVPLDTMVASPALASSGSPETLRWCAFAGSRRIVCQLSIQAQDAGLQFGMTRLVAADLNGANVKLLGQKRSAYDERVRQFDGDILDFLPDDEGRVLIAREYVPEAGKIGSLIARRADGLGVDRLDTSTLRSERVESPTPSAEDYLSDGRGNVRVRALRSRGNGQRMGGEIIYQYRAAGSLDWLELGRFDSVTGSGVRPLALDGERAVFALKKLEGRRALYRIGLERSLPTELVYANPEVDVDGVIRAASGTRVIGVSFADERRHAIYFDADAERLVGQIGRALPNTPLVDIVASDLSGSKLIVHAGSDVDPGRYYLFDTATKRLGELGAVRPQLADVPLSAVTPVRVPAADGASIPAYLTLPPGHRTAQGLPGVVLPHGGPSARDEWGFDWLPQFLANRGYAVLQPNYRGSDGFGDDWFQQNGFRGWEAAIGDITAGAGWLIAQGVPADRLAIVGWSYGGYAALQSAAVSPGTYKAVVAIAPVTDLQLLKDEARDFTSSALVAEFVGDGPHVRAGSPLRQVDRITAPVLLVHGTRDLNVDVEHSEKMQAALRSAGKRSEFLRFRWLGARSGVTAAARTTMLTRIADFLETNLK